MEQARATIEYALEIVKAEFGLFSKVQMDPEILCRKLNSILKSLFKNLASSIDLL